MIIFFFIFLWLLNLELNPSLGNVWWRITTDGHRSLNLNSLCTLFTKPLTYCGLWHPRFWDVNPYTYFFLCGVIIDVLRKTQQDRNRNTLA